MQKSMHFGGGGGVSTAAAKPPGYYGGSSFILSTSTGASDSREQGKKIATATAKNGTNNLSAVKNQLRDAAP